MIDLITGHQGVAHISAEQVSTINKSMMNGYGSGQIVRLKDGTITDGTLSVIISTGYWRMDGYDMEIQEADTLLLDAVTTPGDSRIDIIFVELLQDIATGVQRCEYVIIQGEPDPTPSEPATPTEPQNDTDSLILVMPMCKCTVHDDDSMDFEDLTIPFDVQAGPRIFLGESSTWDDMSLDERAYYDNCEVIFEDGGPYHIYIYYASSDTLSPIAGDPGPAMAKTPKYATCNTSSGTAIKVATTLNNDFVLQTGAVVFVQFDYITATVTDPKLNVDSTGAKFIKAYGTTKPARWWRQGDIVQFVYDGTYWIMYPTSGQINNIDDDITTLNASLTEISITPTVASNYSFRNYKITSKNNRVVMNAVFDTPSANIPTGYQIKCFSIPSNYAPSHNTWGSCYVINGNGSLAYAGGCFIATDGNVYYSIGSTHTGPVTFALSITYDIG